jgi:lipopolysaccharide biosynthesis regulator YciM
VVNSVHEKDTALDRSFVAVDKNRDMQLKIRNLNMALKEDKRYTASGRKRLPTGYRTIQDTKETIVFFKAVGKNNDMSAEILISKLSNHEINDA